MHHFHNLSSAVSRMHDLTLAQFRLIQLLAQKEKCTVKEIAHELGIAQISASEQTSRMVKAGLLQRKPCENDRRINHIVLTDSSTEILHERAEAMRNHIKKTLDRLTPKQQKEFVTAFKKINLLLDSTLNTHSEKQTL
ncbi:MAG: MarR family transcriptional regulator [Calditrichaeota bacterium]|nr:MAG: MarR family transcriptional regulator [Calditrichota bacterium]